MLWRYSLSKWVSSIDRTTIATANFAAMTLSEFRFYPTVQQISGHCRIFLNVCWHFGLIKEEAMPLNHKIQYRLDMYSAPYNLLLGAKNSAIFLRWILPVAVLGRLSTMNTLVGSLNGATLFCM